jgi:hypothetical protein
MDAVKKLISLVVVAGFLCVFAVGCGKDTKSTAKPTGGTGGAAAPAAGGAGEKKENK